MSDSLARGIVDEGASALAVKATDSKPRLSSPGYIEESSPMNRLPRRLSTGSAEQHGSLVLAQAAIQGLTDLAADRVVTEAQLDDALSGGNAKTRLSQAPTKPETTMKKRKRGR
jgi:hypothetical protein